MIRSEQPASEGFAVSRCSYPCPWCQAINDAWTAEWCNCVSASPTLMCHACARCFCAATTEWRARAFEASAWMMFLSRQAALKASRLVPHEKGIPLARPVILVVDDDKVVHVLARRVLASLGGTLLHAFDGAEAWALSLETRPDLVITDALLPKLDGRELSRRLKTDSATKNCRVIVITALYKGLRYRTEAFREFLVDEYESKPVSPARLRALAERHLDLERRRVSRDPSLTATIERAR
jgi:CheY-like chemotaxis protein